jgi:hypothetical protein
MRPRLQIRSPRLLAAVLVAVLSGVPQAAWAAAGDDCCGERCESERDGRDCPPNCPSPSCAKVFPSAVPPSRAGSLDAPDRAEPGVAGIAAPALPLVLSGVFHPPRR